MLDSKSLAFGVASVLAEHRAHDVVILDLRGIAGWTDFFVVGTSTSSTHMGSLARFTEEYCAGEKIESLNKPTARDDESWLLLDLGDIVVHIMNQDARAFYELEKLWFKAPAIRIATGETAAEKI